MFKNINHVHSILQNKMLQIDRMVFGIDHIISEELARPQAKSIYGIVINKPNPRLQEVIDNMQYYDLTNILPNIIWSSAFLTLYSTFEHSLDDLCSSLQICRKLRILPKDLKDRGIIRSEAYLTKVVQIDISSSAIEWQTMKSANLVRNCLSHAAGIIDDLSYPNELRSILKDEKYLSEVEGHLVISKQYILKLTETCRNIFDKTMKALN